MNVFIAHVKFQREVNESRKKEMKTAKTRSNLSGKQFSTLMAWFHHKTKFRELLSHETIQYPNHQGKGVACLYSGVSDPLKSSLFVFTLFDLQRKRGKKLETTDDCVFLEESGQYECSFEKNNLENIIHI